jgi:hypothetical protein
MSHEVIAKVQKLLRMTENKGCSEAEAQNALARASKLLFEHNLSMDDVKGSFGERDEEFIEEDVVSLHQWTQEEQLCYSICTDFFFVQGYLSRHVGRKTLIFFGTPANVQTAKFVYYSLGAAMERLWLGYKITNGKPASERRAYVIGVAKGFKDRLEQERRTDIARRDVMEMTQPGRGTEMVLAGKSAALNEAFDLVRENRNLKARNGRFAEIKGEQSTLDAGIAAGRKLTLNRAVGGPKRKSIG